MLSRKASIAFIISFIGTLSGVCFSHAQQNAPVLADGKDVGPEVLLLEKPKKEDVGHYITLSEPSTASYVISEKQLRVSQSFAVRPSPVFTMGSAGSAVPSAFSGWGATTGGSQLTFSYADTTSGTPNPGALGISVGSQFLIEPSLARHPIIDDLTQMRQVYNLSVGMGYAGFTVGASYGQEKMLTQPGLQGFDVSLGYYSKNWGADLRVGDYRRAREALFAPTDDFYNRVSAVEIGAAYQLYNNIRFTGRFTYYAYGQEDIRDSVKNSQVFFLGTNVNF